MTNTYDINDLVVVSAEFQRVSDGTDIDPTVVVITVHDPDGNTTTPAVSNPSVGVWTAQVAPTITGLWKWRAVGTGAAQAGKDGSFFVREPSF